MFPKNLPTTSGLSILLHGIISLPDAMSYDTFHFPMVIVKNITTEYNFLLMGRGSHSLVI